MFSVQASGAACPGEDQDGKVITVTGRITSIEKLQVSRTEWVHAMEIAGCGFFNVQTKDLNGCAVGKVLRAKGKFDWLYEEILATSLTCL